MKILLLIFAFAVQLCAAELPPTLEIGAPAPDFSLPDVDGKVVSLKDFDAAKVLCVIFTCNHCPTAQAYEERIKAITADYRDKGVRVVAISPNDPKSVRLDELGYTELGDSAEDMKVRAKEKAFNFPYLYDGDAEAVSRAYGPRTTPHAFVFDQDRRLRYVGRIDDSEREPLVKARDLRNALDALLAGHGPEPAVTKAFGCSIKWAGKQEQVAQFMEKLAGETVTLDPVDAAGLTALRKGEGTKLRLINVWATWCGPCVAEFPALVEINRMYRKRPFEFITIAAQFPDERERVQTFLEKQQASAKNLIFANTDKAAMLESIDKEWSGALPFTLLLAPDGKVLYRHEGAVDAMELKKTILSAIGRESVK